MISVKEKKHTVLLISHIAKIAKRSSHLEEIFEKALDLALEKKDPKRKLERRRKREAKKRNSSLGKPGAENSERKKAEKQAKPTPSRYIPSEVRERVLERAGYQCEYRGPDGVRCSCRTGLQIEHTKPFAVWRSHDERFLKAFCPAHNRYAAKKFYGPALIQAKIEAGRNGVGVGGSG